MVSKASLSSSAAVLDWPVTSLFHVPWNACAALAGTKLWIETFACRQESARAALTAGFHSWAP